MLLEIARKAEATQPSPRQTQQDREAARAQSRQDIADGRRMFLEQQARQAEESDPEAQRMAFYKAQALRIVNAGLRARGQPLRRCLVQDEPFQPGYEREPAEGYPDTDPSEGDDAPHPPNKGKKKVTKKKVQDEDDGEQADGDEPVDEGGDDFDSDNEKKKRDKAAALLILNAGRRAKGLPLLTLQDML